MINVLSKGLALPQAYVTFGRLTWLCWRHACRSWAEAMVTRHRRWAPLSILRAIDSWGTPIIAEHEAWCAWSFLYDTGQRDRRQVLETKHIKDAASTQRRRIYGQLVYHARGTTHTGSWDACFPTSLPRKLRRFFPNASKALIWTI
jgi:hypothetical protein